MILHKKNPGRWYYVLFLLFCFVYHFLFAGRNSNNGFYDIVSYTVNTMGYLSYIHTATFYTVFFVFILGKKMIRLSVWNLTRITRNELFVRNTIISLQCAGVYSLCFCMIHLIFMQFYFSTDALRSIYFYRLLCLQVLAYLIYYFLTSQIVIMIYYLSLSCIAGQLIAIGINIIMMFGYRLLQIYSPIQCTLVYTKYYNLRMPEILILNQILILIPMGMVMVLITGVSLKWKDVL